MPALPVIDALILAGSGGLAIGFVLKVIWITTSYRPTFLGFTPIDILLMAGTLLGLALTLAARTWVKHHEMQVYGAAEPPRPETLGYAPPPREERAPVPPATPEASRPPAAEPSTTS